MSASGVFLILFLLVHLTVNSFLLLDPLMGTSEGEMFNAGVHFMGTTPIIKIIEPILFIGFIIHIVYSLILTLQNMRARGSAKYASGNKTPDVEWTSKNMLPLGIALIAFLIIHLVQFWAPMQFTGDPLLTDTTFSYFGEIKTGHNAYALVHATFQIPWVIVAYIIGGVALAFHLSHGFWSAFHSVGFSNKIWIPRLQKASVIIAWVIGLGFCTIAIGQYFFFPLS